MALCSYCVEGTVGMQRDDRHRGPQRMYRSPLRNTRQQESECDGHLWVETDEGQGCAEGDQSLCVCVELGMRTEEIRE